MKDGCFPQLPQGGCFPKAPRLPRESFPERDEESENRRSKEEELVETLKALLRRSIR